jgi:hypothetical protein
MLTTGIAQDVGGTFRSMKQQDMIHEATTPPTWSVLDRTTQRYFIRMVTTAFNILAKTILKGGTNWTMM